MPCTPPLKDSDVSICKMTILVRYPVLCHLPPIHAGLSDNQILLSRSHPVKSSPPAPNSATRIHLLSWISQTHSNFKCVQKEQISFNKPKWNFLLLNIFGLLV